MAKFAVVFLAVVAAASAGVLMPYNYHGSNFGSYGGYGYGLGSHGYPSDVYDNLYSSYTQKYGQHVYETPVELLHQIRYVFTDLSSTFENTGYFTEHHSQLLSVYARHFAYIIKSIVHQLEAYEHADVMIHEVIQSFREIYINFEKLAEHSVFTDVHYYRTEFYSYIQLTVAQIEKLVILAQQEHHGTFFFVIKDVLHFFLYGLYDIHYQLKQVVGYGHHYGVGYGQGYPWYSGFKAGQGYGYPWYKFGQQYGVGYGLSGFGHYGTGYGYGSHYTPYSHYWGSSLYHHGY